MSYDIRALTRKEQVAIARQLTIRWKPIGESANEIVARLERQLDTDWITEYLAYHDKPEEN